MSKPFKPLLAEPVVFDHLDYGNTWLSPKLDGIRAIVINGVVVSRNLKVIRNHRVQALFGNRPELEGIDGELIVGDPKAKDCYQVTNSGVMSADGEPDVYFYVFDHITEPTLPYHLRHRKLLALASDAHVRIVQQHGLTDHQSLLDLEQFYLNQGYEGVMLREFDGPRSFYKYGRSTAKECTLLKLKRFTDAEAPVIGYEEEMQNNNEATTNALGHTERSSHAENKVGKGRLGALICEHPDTSVEFKVGTGFDQATRISLWADRESLIGRTVKYKSFQIGVKDAPRFPVYLGFRDPIDM